MLYRVVFLPNHSGRLQINWGRLPVIGEERLWRCWQGREKGGQSSGHRKHGGTESKGQAKDTESGGHRNRVTESSGHMKQGIQDQMKGKGRENDRF